MNWREQETAFEKLRREAARLEAEQVDRELNPYLYEQHEIPAVWNHSDLADGDNERDEGKR